MSIEILAPAVANQIAAGEVVERPASAVKELIENSLDAGATEIRVEVREGGRRLIRVQDDGCGIPAAETRLLFRRHATSKISRAEDLDHLATLGFRGEALASIASVAQVTLLTCARSEAVGSLLRASAGQDPGRADHGTAPGTVITVEHLFANVPARLKFLKQPATETGQVLQIVTRYALAFPERRFSLTGDGRLLFQSTGSGKLHDVLVKAYGLDVAQQMLPLADELPEDEVSPASEPPAASPAEPARPASPDGVRAAVRGSGDGRPMALRIRGYAGVPALNRGNRSYITLFINRRWFQDNSLAHAVIQAYHTLLPVGRYPVALIFIDLDPGEVDVNVHPTKAAVRFRNSAAVFGAVQRSVRRALTERAPIPAVQLGGKDASSALPAGEPAWQMAWDDEQIAGWSARRQVLLGAGRDLSSAPGEEWPHAAAALHGAGPAPGEAPAAPPKIPLLRVVGQVAATYVVAEGPDGLYLIDQHAAHERILYERMLAARAQDAIEVQPLVAPLVLELSPEQAAVAAQELDRLRPLGVVLEPFGGRSYLLRALPAVLSHEDPDAALREVLDGFLADHDAVAGAHEARLVTLICKRAAVKGGHVLALPEMQELVRQLEACRSPRTCPHGRPTMVHVSAGELARQFGRT
jgi:DNA mismatch repair protein MutL